jgi:NADH-quinone oxidoreductase subunit M
MPFAAAMFAIAGLSSMGMPGLAGFWAELNIFIGLWNSYPLVAVIAALAIPITGAYILRALHQVFFGELSSPAFAKLPPLTWQERAGALLLALILVGVGLYPAILTEPISGSVAEVVQSLNAAGLAGR